MPYVSSPSLPNPATLELIAQGERFDYLTNGRTVFSFGKIEAGTNSSTFGDLAYFRLMLTHESFRQDLTLTKQL